MLSHDSVQGDSMANSSFGLLWRMIALDAEDRQKKHTASMLAVREW
jgi:hypothetical protein